MAEKNKIVVLNKKSPKGIINMFGNIQNRVGTYDKDKIEQFKKKLLEKTLEFGEKFLIIFDEFDYAIISVTDKFIDKILDSYDNYKNKELVEENRASNGEDIVIGYSSEEYTPSIKREEVVPTRRINFEDLEPLGNIIDEEDDVVSLQELKIELLSGDYHNIDSMEENGMQKK